MSDQSTPPDPKRRSFFRIFTDPDAAAEFGRQAGRAVRELRDALDPPSVPVEQYEAALAEVEALQQQVTTLQAEGVTSRQQLDALLRQGAERDQQIMAAIQQLRVSPSQRDQSELERWRKLRQVLWAALGGAVGVAGKETASALYQAWVQEDLYPGAKDLVERLLRPRSEQPAAPLSPVAPPEAGLEVLEPAAPTEPVQWHAGAPEMVYVPAGWFWMGSDKKQDSLALDNEKPLHNVNVGAYWIGRFPITVAQFAAFAQATGYQTAAEQDGSAYVYTGLTWERVQGANWRHPRGPDSNVAQKQDHPVTCIAWRDAQAYCAWLSQTSGRLYRLPSETEWEKAARGTDRRLYPWGNAAPTQEHCNFNMNVGDTTPVGSYPKGASPYGVLDMSGNVWEWTSSLFKGYPYDPADGREALHGEGSRTVRGGSFLSHDGFVRCACRNFSIDPDYNVGLRVASPGF